MDWLSVDPITSLNASHIVSWRQDFDIKLLIKLKLNSNGLSFDATAERELENFIKMKQKLEYNKTQQNRAQKDPIKR